MFDLEIYVFVILFFVLNLDNFKYAEIIYDFALEDFLKKNDEKITGFRMSISQWYYANIGFWWDYFKRTVIGMLAAASGLLPASIQPFVQGMVTRANQYATGSKEKDDDLVTQSSDTQSLDNTEWL